MTIVCCWFDESSGRKRITAIADARAATQAPGGSWVPLSDTTVKLFRASVKCHSMDSFQKEAGSWANPYFQTEIGIGFAGYCFEALTVIALLSRTLEQLVQDGRGEPDPEPLGILNLAREIMERYFASHTNLAHQVVEILIFGFSPSTLEPWCGKVEKKPGKPSIMRDFTQPMKSNDFLAIGDIAKETSFRASVEKLRRRISRHREDIAPGSGEDARFEYDVEVSRHYLADKKIIEDLTLEKLESEFSTTVGGVLQKVEVYPTAGGAAVVSFCRDDQDFLLNGLPHVTPASLGYVPIGEKMGRK